MSTARRSRTDNRDHLLTDTLISDSVSHLEIDIHDVMYVYLPVLLSLNRRISSVKEDSGKQLICYLFFARK